MLIKIQLIRKTEKLRQGGHGNIGGNAMTFGRSYAPKKAASR
jgi:hypothetical protein